MYSPKGKSIICRFLPLFGVPRLLRLGMSLWHRQEHLASSVFPGGKTGSSADEELKSIELDAADKPLNLL